MRVLRLLRIERFVASLEASAAFYRDALGFVVQPVASPASAGDERALSLLLGEQELRLREVPPGAEKFRKAAGNDIGFQHFAIVASDIAAACDQVRRVYHDPISIGDPVRLPPHTGAVTAWKFRDPDGHPLELIAFPRGIGDARWQEAPGAITLGIDHSAISVGDVEASIGFYQQLGFTLAARDVNTGDAQGRLDGLDDPEVAVVALVPSAPTPHLELLGYRHPMPARGMPAGAFSDILVFAVDDLTERPENQAGQLLVADPDGHRLCFEATSGADKAS